MLMFKIFIVIIIISTVTSLFPKRMLEKYLIRYLDDCPNRTVQIPKQDLPQLALVVHGADSSKRIRYNYFQAHLIAQDAYLNRSRKTLIYVGGYLDTPDFLHVRIMEHAYLKLGYNVIMVDQLFFVSHSYSFVSKMIRIVAYHIAEMLAQIYRAGVLIPARVEMVGISLGGHSMAYIAKSFYQLTGKKIGRLTGLDPAGPCFRNLDPEDRLDKTDGTFVDVIHTDIDVFGMATPMGHMDFYVNGGELQASSLTYPGFCDSFCSHIRSYFIWLAALTIPQASFIAIQCENVEQAKSNKCYDQNSIITNVLGLNTNKRKHGIFYLKTSNSFPYFLSGIGLSKDNNKPNPLLIFDWGKVLTKQYNAYANKL